MVIVTIGSMGLLVATNESMVIVEQMDHRTNSNKWINFVATTIILFQDLTSLMAMLDLVMLVF